MDEKTVKVRLASRLNMSFDHEVDTGISVEDWREMDEDERERVVGETVCEWIEAYAVVDG